MINSIEKILKKKLVDEFGIFQETPNLLIESIIKSIIMDSETIIKELVEYSSVKKINKENENEEGVFKKWKTY